MSQFQQNLSELPSVEQLARLELYREDSYEPAAIIENRPGQAGSLAVYYKVSVDFGGIGPKAAEQALDLYAEHTDDAKRNPGKHPNIDRLFDVIASNQYYSVKAIRKN